MKKFAAPLALGLALSISGAAIALPSSSVEASALGAVKADTRTVTFEIENMTCAMCPVTVRTAMKRVDGVRSVDVDFDNKTAVVVFDPDVTTAELIAQASTDVGYPAYTLGAEREESDAGVGHEQDPSEDHDH